MPSPEWRRVTAADDSTKVRMLQHAGGDVSIKLRAGAVSIVAAISDDDLAFLAATPIEQKEAA